MLMLIRRTISIFLLTALLAAAAGISPVAGSSAADVVFDTGRLATTSAAAVETLAASGITDTSAVLNGNLTSLGEGNSISVMFKYGLSAEYGSVSSGRVVTESGTFGILVSGLSPGTLYHFRAMAGEGESAVSGSGLTFETLSRPQVALLEAADITHNSAVLRGELVSLGTATAVNIYFEYGKTGDYGSTTSVQIKTAAGPLTASINDLDPATVYSFRIIADGGVNGTSLSEEGSFTTLEGEPPVVVTLNPTVLTGRSAVLQGNLDSPGTASAVLVFFEYGIEGLFNRETPLQSMTGTGGFEAEIASLEPGVEYGFRAVAVGHGRSTGTGQFFRTLTAPGVTTSFATDLTENSAVLNGLLLDMGLADTVNVYFEYGPDENYGEITLLQSMAETGVFSAEVSGLFAQEYHFRARADAGIHGSGTGDDMNFSIPPLAPEVSTLTAGEITNLSAVLRGELNSMGSSPVVEVYFRYGTTTDYGQVTARQTMTGSGEFTASLPADNMQALIEDKTYYFQAVAEGYGVASGAGMSFHTHYSPIVDTLNLMVTDVTANSAVLRGTLVSAGSAGTAKVYFEYGKRPEFGRTTDFLFLSDPGDFSLEIPGELIPLLEPNTLYYYRAVADGEEHGISYGSLKTFTTGKKAPSIMTLEARDITDSSAVLYADLSDLGTAQVVYVHFLWGPGDALVYTTEPQPVNVSGEFTLFLNRLLPNTEYSYRAIADGGDHGSDEGDIETFRTGNPPVVQTGSADYVMATSAVINGSLISLGSADSVDVLFEWGTTDQYGFTTQAQSTSTTWNFSAVIYDLNPDTEYHFRAVAADEIYGTGTGDDRVFKTSNVDVLKVDTSPVTDIGGRSATLNGFLLNKGENAEVEVNFEYWDESNDRINTPPLVMKNAGVFQTVITGLEPDKEYSYQAKAKGNRDEAAGGELSFTTITIPPSAVTLNATAVTSSEASLNAVMTSMGTADMVDLFFEYGKTPEYGNISAVQTKSNTGTFFSNISNLDPATLYHYRAVADGGISGLFSGKDNTFTTGEPYPPVIKTYNFTNLTDGSATLIGELLSKGTAAQVEVYFEYGTSSQYGASTETLILTENGQFTVDLGGLVNSTEYHFRAVADGRLHGKSSGTDLDFVTLTPPSAVTETPALVKQESARLNGSLVSMGTASLVYASFEYGLTEEYGQTTAEVTLTSIGSFTADISGLLPGTAYHYRARVRGGVNGESRGEDMTFTTLAPPGVITLAATDITSSAAILNADLSSLGTSSNVNVFFEYGADEKYGCITPVWKMSTIGTFYFNFSGLAPETTYHFRAAADGGPNGLSAGNDMTFTTSAVPAVVTVPPWVGTGPAVDITTGSAVLQGYLISMGQSESVEVAFEYGATDSYGMTSEVLIVEAAGPFSVAVSGLSPNAAYHYRARATGTSGTDSGADMNFVTLKVPPEVSTLDAAGISGNSAVLRGSLFNRGSAGTVEVYFEYGLTADYGNTTEKSSIELGVFSFDLSSRLPALEPETTYHYRAVADGGEHGLSAGEDMTFTTLKAEPPVVLTLTSSMITSGSATLIGSLASLGTARQATVSFEYGPTAEYGSLSTAIVRYATGVFIIPVSGLNPGTEYHFRALASGGSHGLGKGADVAFTTLTPPAISSSVISTVNGNSTRVSSELISMGTAASVSACFEYGPTTDYGNTSEKQIMTAPGVFSADIKNLLPGSAYHVRSRMDGAENGVAYGDDVFFQTLAAVSPAVNTTPASEITGGSVTLNGYLVSTGTAASVSVYYEYGTTVAYGSRTSDQVMTAEGPFSCLLDNLNPGKIYHFRAVADGGVHGKSTGSDMQFTTLMPPVVFTLEAEDITCNAARISGSLAFMGTTDSALTLLEYWTDDYYEIRGVALLTEPGTFSTNLTDLDPGTTYSFRAGAMGGIHGDGYGEELTFTTLEPPVVSTAAATNITSSAATLNGSLDEMGTADPVSVYFEYGLTTGYGYATAAQDRASEGGFSINVSGLIPGKTYHYRARANGGINGTHTGQDSEFTTGTIAPAVVTLSALEITGTSALLRGNLASLGTAPEVMVFFDYGTSIYYGSSTQQQGMTTTGDFNVTVEGLIPGTTYHFRARANGYDHGTATGTDFFYTTPIAPPQVETLEALSITPSSAAIRANLTSMGTATTVIICFEWGTSSAYGNITESMEIDETGFFVAGLSGLESGTTYYYRARADGGVSGIAYSEARTFKTLLQPPSVKTLDAIETSIDGTILKGELLSTGAASTVTVRFEWGKTASYGNLIEVQDMEEAGEFSYSLTGLEAGTIYHFRALADGGEGGVARGEDKTFETQFVAPEVETLASDAITAGSAALNGSLISMGTFQAVEVSFEYGKSLDYGTVIQVKEMTETGDFRVTIIGLEEGTTYYFRARAGTQQSGWSYGERMSFQTAVLLPQGGTDPAQAVTTTTAALYGSLISLGVSDRVEVYFEYGTTDSYGSRTASLEMTQPGSFNSSIASLFPGKIYHYRAVLDVGELGLVLCNDAVFTTRSTAGGGGGGGGAVIVLPSPKVTSTPGKASWSTTISGLTPEKITVTSADGRCIITIEKGTLVTDSKGNLVKSVTCDSPEESAAAPEDKTIAGIYELEPSGTRFSPAAGLMVRYDRASLPQGSVEEDLLLAFFDEQAGTWTRIENTTVDTTDFNVNGKINHFTQFALLAVQPVELAPAPSVTASPSPPPTLSPIPSPAAATTAAPVVTTSAAPVTTSPATTVPPQPTTPVHSASPAAAARISGIPLWALIVVALVVVLAAAALLFLRRLRKGKEAEAATDLSAGSNGGIVNKLLLFVRRSKKGTQAVAAAASFSTVYNSGNANYRQKKYDAAIVDYTRAIELDPSRGIAYSNRGAAHSAKGEYEKALADHSKAIEIDPAYSLGYYNRAMVYSLVKRRAEAIADLEKVISLKNNPALVQAAEKAMAKIKKEK